MSEVPLHLLLGVGGGTSRCKAKSIGHPTEFCPAWQSETGYESGYGYCLPTYSTA